MSDTTPAYYGADAVGPFLTWPLVNEAVESALKAVVKSSPALTAQPRRTFTPIGSQSVQDQGLLLTMPAFVGNYETSSRGGSSTLACKLVTSFSGNAQRQPPLPSILAHVLVFSHQTGQLAAIMEATDLTTRRTVAASLVSTKYLYFRRFGPDAEVTRPITVAIVGCGVQGQMHALAFCQSFRVEKLLLYNRSRAKAEELAKLIGLEVGGQAVEVCESSREACHEADVICVATFAKEPLIHSEDLKPSGGVHINGELDYELKNGLFNILSKLWALERFTSRRWLPVSTAGRKSMWTAMRMPRRSWWASQLPLLRKWAKLFSARTTPRSRTSPFSSQWVRLTSKTPSYSLLFQIRHSTAILLIIIHNFRV